MRSYKDTLLALEAEECGPSSSSESSSDDESINLGDNDTETYLDSTYRGSSDEKSTYDDEDDKIQYETDGGEGEEEEEEARMTDSEDDEDERV